MNSILNAEVSVFQSYLVAKPLDTMTLYDWVTCGGYKKEIEALRKLKNQEKVKSAKMQLPAITPSGIFKESRSAKNLKNHSGFICIDIDGNANPNIQDWEKTKCEIGNNTNIAYAGLSASGKGIFVLVPIAFPEKHFEHFQTLEFYFLTKHGIYIDKACKDICRLRGVSYDGSAYFNHSAKPLITHLPSANITSLRPDYTAPDTLAVKQLLNSVMSQKTDVTDSYNDWFAIGCVIANTYGDSGRKMYHHLSRLSPKYNAADCDKQYSACLKTKYNYGIGTLNHILNKYKD